MKLQELRALCDSAINGKMAKDVTLYNKIAVSELPKLLDLIEVLNDALNNINIKQWANRNQPHDILFAAMEDIGTLAEEALVALEHYEQVE